MSPASSQGGSYTQVVDRIRRVRLPIALAVGVVYVALLPWLGWHPAQPVLLAVAVLVLCWLPGIDTFIRNFKSGYSEPR